jgi:hypothetical protein
MTPPADPEEDPSAEDDLDPLVRAQLVRHGLARSFDGFDYRQWSPRWKNWLMHNPLDGRWYSFAPKSNAWIRAPWMAYDPPKPGRLPADVAKRVLSVPRLPSVEPPVNRSPEPSSNPPPVPRLSGAVIPGR